MYNTRKQEREKYNMKALEKSSPIPLYYQLYSGIISDIHNGILLPGDKLPTESELMEKFGLSRKTVRHALNDLSKEGYLIRATSRGTIVKDNATTLVYTNQVKGFTAQSRANGYVKLGAKVLACEIAEPPVQVKEFFNLKDGEKVFYLKRLRTIESKPALLVDGWLDYRRLKGIEKINFKKESLYDVLEKKYNVNPSLAKRTFTPLFAQTAEQIKLLKISKNTPLLRCESWVYDESGAPIEYYIGLTCGNYTVTEGHLL